MTDIVLIHGAFHGGWCWRGVAERLRSAGHRVIAPTLTGLGERSHLIAGSVDLEVHIRDIVNVFEWEEIYNAVLVAHSYAGMPVTGAADRLCKRIRALVYLDALLPADGQSALSIRSEVPGAVPLPASPDGIAVPPPPATVFGVEGAEARRHDRLLTPHPLATLTQPAALSGAWMRVPRKLYLRMARYPAPAMDAAFERTNADPDWLALNHDEVHNVMATDPDWLVGVLSEHVLDRS